MTPPRKVLVGILGISLVAVLVWFAFGGALAAPGDTDTDVRDSHRPAASGVQLAAESPPDAAAPEHGAERHAVTAPAGAPRTLLTGRYLAPGGVWPGGGTAELHLPAKPLEGGMMGLMSAGLESARSGADDPELERSIEAWLRRADPVATTTIEASGAFEIVDPPAGTFEVRLAHPTLRDVAPVPAVIAAGTSTDLGSIPTRAGAGLLVLVADRDGQPVADAEVTLGRPIDPSQFMDPSRLGDLTELFASIVPHEARTDARGTCRFAGLEPASAALLRVEADGFVEENRELQLGTGREEVVRVLLSRGGAVAVTVLLPDGTPCDRGRVVLRYPEIERPQQTTVRIGTGGRSTSGPEALRYELRTGNDGVARRGGLPDGRVEILQHTPGYLRARHEAFTEYGETVEHVFRLERGVIVSGRVVDEAGAPVPEAHVMHLPLLGEDVMGFDVGSVVGLDMMALAMDERGVRCDADGRFVLGGFADGEKAFLVAAAAGFDPMRHDAVAGDRDVELVLKRAAAVTGRVIAAADERPLTDFRVTLKQRAFLVFDRPVARRSFTGVEDGRFSLEGAPRSSLELVVEADGFAPATDSVDLGEGGTDVGEIRMLAPAAIEGVVLDTDGTPAPGAKVRVARGGLADMAALGSLLGTESVLSDELGRFRIDGLAGRAVRLLADLDGRAPLRSKAVRIAPGTTTSGVVLQLTAGGRVAGRITDGDGRGLADWNVQLQHSDGRGFAAAVTDHDGRFAAEALAAGTYKVEAVPGDYLERVEWNAGIDEDERLELSSLIGQAMRMTVRDRVVVREGETAEITLVFDDPDAAQALAGTEVAGRVTVGQRALANGLVSLSEPGSTLQQHVTAVHDGAFRFERVPPGTWRLRVQSGILAGGIGEDRIVEVPRGGAHRLDIDLPGGRISGVVLDAEGRPAGGVLLALARRGAESATPLDVVDLGEGAMITDEAGRFTFDGLAAGTYHVTAKELLGTGRSARLTDLVLAESERREGLELVLGEGATLRVEVRDASGPCSNALVSLSAVDGSPVGLLHRALTEPDGVAVFEGVPAGTYRAHADAPGRAPASSAPVQIADRADRSARVDLDRGIAVRVEWTGTVPERLRGQPLSWSVRGPSGATLRAGRVTVPQGGEIPPGARRVPLGRYAPGVYTLRVAGTGLGVVNVEREVPEDGEAVWAFDLGER